MFKGKLYFIEHIEATNNLKRYQWQRRLALCNEIHDYLLLRATF